MGQKQGTESDNAKANQRQFTFRANRELDADIIDWLETRGNIQSYLKELIRRDIATYSKKKTLVKKVENRCQEIPPRKAQVTIDQFAAFLDSTGATYRKNASTIVVQYSTRHVETGFMDVIFSPGDSIMITDYIGLSPWGIQRTNRYVKAIQKRYSNHHFYIDKYASYEIGLSDHVYSQTPKELNDQVEEAKRVIEECFIIGREMLGEGFYQ